MQEALIQTVREICEKDTRYLPEGYIFVLEALEFTAKMLNKPAKSGRERHVAGRELLEGVRHYAIQEFGPMALTVLSSWGLTRSEDFGEIVFNLVDSGKLRKTEEDSKADFANGYDFADAFTRPFLPEAPPPKPSVRKSRQTRDTKQRKSGAPPADG
jgi:uncharacterized repeat protein (TIGR04138 family)